MAKQSSGRQAKIGGSSGPQQGDADKPLDKFMLPLQPADTEQWADIFHIQIGPLGVRLWFGTSRGDASGLTDIRAAMLLPGEVGRLFLAHARKLAEVREIELNAEQSPPLFN
ncbi:hypothetical protein OIU35_30130 [Boseaceae bacterium BT-24-1]|nr:hypothetical protein [Boseaceae bacterium BT-24-1]